MERKRKLIPIILFMGVLLLFGINSSNAEAKIKSYKQLKKEYNSVKKEIDSYTRNADAVTMAKIVSYNPFLVSNGLFNGTAYCINNPGKSSQLYGLYSAFIKPTGQYRTYNGITYSVANEISVPKRLENKQLNIQKQMKAYKTKVKFKIPSIIGVGKYNIRYSWTKSSHGNKIKWKSSDKRIATVNSKGIINAKKTGVVTISAITSIGKLVTKAKIEIRNLKEYQLVVEECDNDDDWDYTIVNSDKEKHNYTLMFTLDDTYRYPKDLFFEISLTGPKKGAKTKSSIMGNNPAVASNIILSWSVWPDKLGGLSNYYNTVASIDFDAIGEGQSVFTLNIEGETYYFNIEIKGGNNNMDLLGKATPKPIADPDDEEMETPTPAPTAVPTPEPTEMPDEDEMAIPTPEPTAVPTPEPTEMPDEDETAIPTPEPTAVPDDDDDETAIPTPEPTAVPDDDEMAIPTPAPTPTAVPTPEPTAEPYN